MTSPQPGRCASCKAALTPGARFCRACGAAVEATERAASPASPPPPSAGSRRCPTCAAPALVGASFCHSCGAPLEGRDTWVGAAADRAPAAAAPPSAPAAEDRRRHPLRPVAAVAACLLVGALVAAGAYLATRDGDSGGAGGATGASSGGGAEREEVPPKPQAPPRESELVPGRYVQSGSFRSLEGAEEEVARLRGHGIDVFAIPADQVDELLPGFQVLLVGPLAGAAEERRVVRELERAAVSGFGRDVTPSVELSGPSSAAGAWSGEVEQSSLRGAARPTTYPVDVTIAAGGETGTVDYPEDECGGTLTLIEDDGYSLAYAETVEYGPCIRGGVWHLRPTAEGMKAVWLHDSRDIMVEGTLSPLG